MAAERPSPAPGPPTRAGWPIVKRVLATAAVVGVAALLIEQARSIDWPAVAAALAALPIHTLAAAGLLSATSYALFASYDLFGRQQTRHGLTTRKVVAIGCTVYGLNMSLGSLVGAIGTRFRLYSRHGLDAETIAPVMLLSVLTNWLGYLLLGAACSFFRR